VFTVVIQPTEKGRITIMPRKNTGTIFQRKDGLFVFQINFQGQRITKYANTQPEAEQLRQQFFTKPAPTPITPDVLTLSVFLQKYLAITDLKPTTKRTFEVVFSGSVCPTLGNIAIASITPLDIANLIAHLRDKGLMGTTIKTTYNLLNAVLNAAVRWEVISQNPASKVKPPKKDAKPKTVWTVAQTQQFLASCQANVTKWEPLFIVAVNTGLRIGELLGLQWSDLDYTRKTLKVQRSLAELPDVGFLVQTPKTRSSIRTIALSKDVFDAFDRWEPDPTKRSGFVFFPDGKHPMQDAIRISLKRLCSRAKLPYLSPHGLRHQHISLLAHAGVSIKAAQVRAGHATALMTLNIYTHVLDETDSATATALDALLATGGK
jgi:integrase